jgi:hypothetical protein
VGPGRFDGLEIEGGYKIDLLAEDLVVVEFVEQQLPIHRAQLLSYLKLTHNEVAVLIISIRRLVNHYQSSASPCILCSCGLISLHSLQPCNQLLWQALI